MARRAYPFDLVTQVQSDSVLVACSHDGYRRLSGQPVHRRTWQMNAAGLSVADSVVGGHHAAVARFILHPQVLAEPHGDNAWRLNLPCGQSLNLSVQKGAGRLVQASYAPEFGKVLPTQCLAVDLVDGQALIMLRWI